MSDLFCSGSSEGRSGDLVAACVLTASASGSDEKIAGGPTRLRLKAARLARAPVGASHGLRKRNVVVGPAILSLKARRPGSVSGRRAVPTDAAPVRQARQHQRAPIWTEGDPNRHGERARIANSVNNQCAQRSLGRARQDDMTRRVMVISLRDSILPTQRSAMEPGWPRGGQSERKIARGPDVRRF